MLKKGRTDRIILWTFSKKVFNGRAGYFIFSIWHTYTIQLPLLIALMKCNSMSASGEKILYTSMSTTHELFIYYLYEHTEKSPYNLPVRVLWLGYFIWFSISCREGWSLICWQFNTNFSRWRVCPILHSTAGLMIIGTPLISIAETLFPLLLYQSPFCSSKY